MKRTLQKLGLIGALSLAGCEVQDERTKKIIDSAQQQGTPKQLTVTLSHPGDGVEHQLRFYDSDGDGKTVEHYVDLYWNNVGIFSHGVAKHLIRPGAEPSFGGYVDLRREMTEEEMHNIDALYQKLLPKFEKSE